MINDYQEIYTEAITELKKQKCLMRKSALNQVILKIKSLQKEIDELNEFLNQAEKGNWLPILKPYVSMIYEVDLKWPIK